MAFDSETFVAHVVELCGLHKNLTLHVEDYANLRYHAGKTPHPFVWLTMDRSEPHPRAQATLNSCTIRAVKSRGDVPVGYAFGSEARVDQFPREGLVRLRGVA